MQLLSSFIFYTRFLQLSIRRAEAYQSLAERQGTPGQVATGPHGDKQPSTLTLTPRVDLESPVNLSCMFLGGGRKPEYPERAHGENIPAGIWTKNLSAWGDGANHHTTVQPSSHHTTDYVSSAFAMSWHSGSMTSTGTKGLIRQWEGPPVQAPACFVFISLFLFHSHSPLRILFLFSSQAQSFWVKGYRYMFRVRMNVHGYIYTLQGTWLGLGNYTLSQTHTQFDINWPRLRLCHTLSSQHFLTLDWETLCFEHVDKCVYFKFSGVIDALRDSSLFWVCSNIRFLGFVRRSGNTGTGWRRYPGGLWSRYLSVE